jgi:hypothetical protein
MTGLAQHDRPNRHSSRPPLLIGCGGCFLVVALVVLGVLQYIGAGIDEVYSPGYMAESAAQARELGMFVSQPKLETPFVEWKGVKYPVREVWIERVTRARYEMLFFRREIPLGYRLMVRIEGPQGAGTFHLPYGEATLTANGLISIEGSGGDVMFTEIQPPLPQSVRLTVERPK